MTLLENDRLAGGRLAQENRIEIVRGSEGGSVVKVGAERAVMICELVAYPCGQKVLVRLGTPERLAAFLAEDGVADVGPELVEHERYRVICNVEPPVA